MNNLKWRAKNDLCGVPGKGFIKAEDLSQEDVDNLIKRAKNRKQDVHTFMLRAGFVPAQPQVEMFEEPQVEIESPNLAEEQQEEKPKRKRRTKAEMEADNA